MWQTFREKKKCQMTHKVLDEIEILGKLFDLRQPQNMTKLTLE